MLTSMTLCCATTVIATVQTENDVRVNSGDWRQSRAGDSPDPITAPSAGDACKRLVRPRIPNTEHNEH